MRARRHEREKVQHNIEITTKKAKIRRDKLLHGHSLNHFTLQLLDLGKVDLLQYLHRLRNPVSNHFEKEGMTRLTFSKSLMS